ncbi:MAG: diphthine--ammonia ligase [Thermoleophilaceae bacterium]|nr:diphthine--ammonia ligase [Thermoleophilaceae bacterium]
MSVALSWSGGKDSALALRRLRELGIEPAALVTTFTEGYERVSMHAVRHELLRAQSEAVGVPLAEVWIPPECSNAAYEERMARAFSEAPLARVEAVAFGDLFLEDVRAYREARLAAAGRGALFPLWGEDTARLAREFVDAGFEATVVCVDPRRLDPSFCGRAYDRALLDDLPPGVDPCGENGEFHTFVSAGPVFETPVPVAAGERVERDGFWFCDLLPAAAAPHVP